MRVLIVDDNPDDRQLVLHQLRAEHPELDCTEILDEQGLLGALAEEPALVITDLHLGWNNGFFVLNAVRERYPECPVIMFTGTGDESSAVEAMKAGVDDYVVKSPRHLTRLRTSIRQVLEGAQHKRMLRQRDEQLRAALARKDIILRELHHRVKNNIQIVTSLLGLQARRTSNEQVKAELNALLERVQILGSVQARIYETEELDRIDFGGLLADVAQSLVELYGRDRVSLDCSFGCQLEMPVQQATPLALLVYEVMLNSVKHGFADGRLGRLSLEIRRPGNGAEIIVRDDGVGFDPDQVVEGMGSKLLHALAREAKATVGRESRPGGGTVVRIRLGSG